MVAFGAVGVLAISGMKSESATPQAPAPAQAIEKANDAANKMKEQAYQQPQNNQQPE